MNYTHNAKIESIKNIRLKKEIKFYLEKNILNQGIIVYDFTHDSCDFMLFEDDKNIKIKIKITNAYPFKAPKVYLNGDKYTNLRMVPHKFTKYISHGCLCCSTILCNWGPTYNLSHIFKEIREFVKIKRRIVERIFAERVVDKYFGHYIPIIEFL